MHLEPNYTQIKDLLMAGNFRAVFRQLPGLFPFDAPEHSDIKHLERRYLEYTRDNDRGVIKREDFQLEMNRLNLALLTLLNKLEEQRSIPRAGRDSSLRTVLRDIRSLLKNLDDLPQAFSRLEPLLEQECKEELPALGALWNNFNTQRDQFIIKQTISNEAYALAMNKTVVGLEELLLKLLKREEAINGHGVVFGSELAVVNCDRKKIVRHFLRSFEEQEAAGRAGHIYLLHHQRYGQSESLVRRLITNLKQQYPGVKYSGFNQIKIKVVDIEAGDTLDDCRFNLRKGFNRGLRPQVSNLAELLDKVQEYYPQFMRATYLPFVLKVKIPRDHWEACGLPALKWFMEDFCALARRGKQVPLIFLVLDVEMNTLKSTKPSLFQRFFRSEKENPAVVFDTQREFLKLVENCSVPFTLLPPLLRIREDDLMDWMEVFVSNEKEREERVAKLIAGLGPSPDGWYMSDVERLLKKLVEEFHNRAVNL